MYKLYLFFRLALYPFLRYLLPFFSQQAQKRLEFELKNELSSHNCGRADYAFEVSSEGELEQVKPLLLEVLNLDKQVELIFCSESVEHRVLDLARAYPKLRIFRLPILSFHPFIRRQNTALWLTARTLILCRYDFFYELIYYGANKASSFILVAGSMKNFCRKNFMVKQYLLFCYRQFSKIIASTKNDYKLFLSYQVKTESHLDYFDFRVLTISQRVAHKTKTLTQKFPIFFNFESWMQQQKKQKVIMGSLWPQEVEAFKEHGKDLVSRDIVCIAPHKLDTEHMLDLKNRFKKLSIPVYVISNLLDENELSQLFKLYEREKGVFLFDVKGVLCELYSSFDFAYVGGGFGSSVHSLLEPYLSGLIVFCGPRVHRSTEYSYIKETSPATLIKLEKISQLLNELIRIESSQIQKQSLNLDVTMKHYARIKAWLEVLK
ncbi:MAG: hypothetical protein QF441_05265 [Bacteriovoracaceae bacterium]|jgi:3-deoxy-D-manno-octulosonic-acid transferase|nr:hypothetical protein [Bacteriovoracaceae bacterium]